MAAGLSSWPPALQRASPAGCGSSEDCLAEAEAGGATTEAPVRMRTEVAD
jgi:hypothetical protein